MKFNLINLFIAFYLVFFTILAYRRGDLEFIYYGIILILLLVFIQFYREKLRLSIPLAIGLAIYGLMHVLGGNIYWHGVRLYDYQFFFFKYDNLVHALSMFLITIVAYNLLVLHLDQHVKRRIIPLALIIILISLGVGSLAENVELLGVIYFNASEKVGDYFNNAYDLVYNALGSVLAAVLILTAHYKKYVKK